MEYYKLFLYKKGILTLLFLLSKFEDNEMYEECEKIVMAIQGHNNDCNDKLPTNLNQSIYDKSKKWFIELGMNPNDQIIRSYNDAKIEFVHKKIYG